MEHVDVIVVGARCAGSPPAALLARRGGRVVVVEQAFPGDGGGFKSVRRSLLDPILAQARWRP